mgnify:CR=1 FL=1
MRTPRAQGRSANRPRGIEGRDSLKASLRFQRRKRRGPARRAARRRPGRIYRLSAFCLRETCSAISKPVSLVLYAALILLIVLDGRTLHIDLPSGLRAAVAERLGAEAVTVGSISFQLGNGAEPTELALEDLQIGGAPIGDVAIPRMTGALTLVAQAGTPLAEIEGTLAAEGQRLAFEPMDHRATYGTKGAPTIGGVVAGNVSGPRRIQAGACRDALIGVRFVDGRGDVLKNGGRVMKNVTGYDLVKLLCGAHGTLGVLTEVAFKVLPQAETAACVAVHGLADGEAVAAMAAALGSPFDVTGAAHMPDGPEGAPQTMIRIEGFSESVAYRSGRLRELLGRFGEVNVESDPETVAARWAGIRDAESLARGDGDIWRVSVKPSDGPAVRAAAGDAVPALYDWGGGLVWLRLPEGTNLRGALGGIAGHATLIRAGDETKSRLGVFQPEPAPIARMSAGLRREFDPHGILNTGRMGPA